MEAAACVMSSSIQHIRFNVLPAYIFTATTMTVSVCQTVDREYCG